MLQYYCIPSCDKCRKARKDLKAREIEHNEIDMRKDGISHSTIERWIGEYGLDEILNQRSTTWKTLSENEKEKVESASARIINTYPTILHRPILDFGDHILKGKDALSWIEKQPIAKNISPQ